MFFSNSQRIPQAFQRFSQIFPANLSVQKPYRRIMHFKIHLYTYVYVYVVIYIYMYMYMCVLYLYLDLHLHLYLHLCLHVHCIVFVLLSQWVSLRKKRLHFFGVRFVCGFWE